MLAVPPVPSSLSTHSPRSQRFAGSGCPWELSLTSPPGARNKVPQLVSLSQNQNLPQWVLACSLKPDSHENSKVFEAEYQGLTLAGAPVALALLVFSAAGTHSAALHVTFAFSSPVIPSDTFHHMIFRQDLCLLLGCFSCPTYVSNFLQSQTIFPEESSIVITSEPHYSCCPC